MRQAFDGMFVGDPPDWKESLMAGVLAVPEATGRPLYRNLLDWDLEAALARIDVPPRIRIAVTSPSTRAI